MYKAGVLISFFLLTPLIIITALSFYSLRDSQLHQKNLYVAIPNVDAKITYSALPSTDGVMAGDIRVEKVHAFFEKYHSLLADYANTIVESADKYGIDYALLPAISMQESIGCKRVPAGTHNCFGWGIYTHKLTAFQSYEEAIDNISRLMAKNYINKGLNTPEEIGKKYNPNNTNHWADKVSYFIDEIQKQPSIAYLTNL